MKEATAPSEKALRSFWRRWLHRPIAFYMVCLILVVVVPAFLFAIIVVERTNEAQERILESLLRTSTGAVNRVVEREVSGMVSTLNFLSTSDHLQKGNFEELHAQAVKALAGSNTHFLLIDRNLHQVLNTRVSYGAPLGPTSDPETAEDVFERDTLAVSNLFFGKTAQKWVFNVYQPVRLASGESMLLTLTKNAESLENAVNRDILSPGWSAAVLDGAGNVIVSTDTTQQTGAPFFLQVVPSLRLGVSTMSHGGEEYRVVTEFSAVTGWKIIAWAKASAVQAPAEASFLWLTIGGLVFAVIAACGGLAIARIVSRDVRMLASDARKLGEGKRIPPRRHAVAELETVSRALSTASDARRRAEGEVRFLMREVAHRSKNQLTVIQAMLNQSANKAESASEFADAFRKRVAGLARSTDLMIDNASQGVNFADLARNQLKPFAPDEPRRLTIAGPEVLLDAQTSQTLGMALHELATNATKYGAFANSDGTVTLTWTDDGETLRIVWRERGAEIEPEHRASDRKGFGSTVLERMLSMALDATLERQMHEDGIEWNVSIPSRNLRAADHPEVADGEQG
ncbi:sensor histidine kinase [Sinorhizobium sp. BG8]|uniref:sensor histidine kinase n=1 Tax=Sinorhizobium sp. BG8 TaxID=2613773 RepID=UPI00193D96A6|nr:sensor histidine kinase [Sinorhizobium sp. BG8]QRM53848.1 histidine kinase [Sinorhizobium sp. BG8]